MTNERRKIFVSYKYGDTSVYQNSSLDKITPNGLLSSILNITMVTPRSYLNYLTYNLSDYAIAKWEKDDNDLSKFKDLTIENKLRDLIYDSSITIVLVSPNMKDNTKPENDQWVPWEISYSLRSSTRNGRTSLPNALIAIVLPDQSGLYDYCLKPDSRCNSINLKFSNHFTILGKTFFNLKNPEKCFCNTCLRDHFFNGNDAHYCIYAKWIDFINNPNRYINAAVERLSQQSNYNIYPSL